MAPYVNKISAISTHTSFGQAIHASISSCFKQLASSTSLQLHGCQLLTTASPYTAEDIQALPKLVQDEISKSSPMFSTSSMTWPVVDWHHPKLHLQHASVPLTAFGGVVDRLLLLHRQEWVPVTGVHCTLFYSQFEETHAETESFFSFHLPPSNVPVRHKTVGRWPKWSTEPPQRFQEEMGGWQALKWRQRWAMKDSVQAGGEILKSKEQIDAKMNQPQSTRQIFVLADNEPSQGLRLINSLLPQSRVEGVLASWTPFFNEHPFTLFLNDKIYHGGMVGCCWIPKNAQRPVLSHAGMEWMDQPYTITQCQGNIVMEIDGQNPVEILQSLLSSSPQTSEIMVSIRSATNHGRPQGEGDLYRILGSSSPGLGRLAIELNGDSDLRKGDVFQFVKRVAQPSTLNLQSPVRELLLFNRDEEQEMQEGKQSVHESDVWETAALGVASSNGFIYSHPFTNEEEGASSQGGKSIWVSTVQTTPGSQLVF